MNQNTEYGVLSKVPVQKLKQIANHLQLKEYLFITNDEYSIVKLTENSMRILDGEEISMKFVREQKSLTREKTVKKKVTSEIALTEVEEQIFEKLRSLRMNIAREEKVPPYIVFSDKTLVHMCRVLPETKETMLSVHGVGDHKFEKYGERFLKALNDTN